MDTHDRQQSYLTDKSKSHPPSYEGNNRVGKGRSITRKKCITAWMDTVWGLIAHAIFSVGIVVFVICYVDGRPFNSSQRRATVQIIGGNATLPFAPIQSDIVTILSSMIVIQRWTLAAWVAPLCWRMAIFLMETRGLHQRDFKVLIKYRLLKPGTYLGSPPTFIMGTLLLTGLVANLSSPALTGSIAWVPRNQPIRESPVGSTWLPEFITGSENSLPSFYLNFLSARDFLAERGAGIVSIGWRRDADKQVYRRVSSSVDELAVGSVIEGPALPYFAIDSIDWIEDENDLPAYAKNKDPSALSEEALKWGPNGRFMNNLGYVLLIPNLTNPTNWSSDSLAPRTIEEKRLLVIFYGAPQLNLTDALPPNTYARAAVDYRWSFAWVTFRAGVGRCKNYQCVISSPSTISTTQNDSPLELEPHPLTFQALSMAMDVSLSLVIQNASIPAPWEDVNIYVEAILVRSYSGAWNALNDRMSLSEINMRYRPALLVLLAQVTYWRVYMWLGLQLSATLLGIIFFIIQSGLSKFPLVGDTALTAFYLDTTGVSREGKSNPFKNGTLRIEQEGDQLTLVKASEIEEKDSIPENSEGAA